MRPTGLLRPDKRIPSKAYLVNELRKAVYKWRRTGYLGVANVTGTFTILV